MAQLTPTTWFLRAYIGEVVWEEFAPVQIPINYSLTANTAILYMLCKLHFWVYTSYVLIIDLEVQSVNVTVHVWGLNNGTLLRQLGLAQFSFKCTPFAGICVKIPNVCEEGMR